MLKIGQYADLEVIKEVDFGLYLDGGAYGEILLPKRYVSPGVKVGQDIRVFIYRDSEERLIATTEEPYAVAGDFALLKVKAISDHGAFLDWGLSKDLFVPFREQLAHMEEGELYLVYIYLDPETDRLLASSRLNRFLSSVTNDLTAGEEIDIMIARKTPEGFDAIINNKYWGRLYKNEIFQKLKIGDTKRGFVKKVRDDGKIDLSLSAQGYRVQIPTASTEILDSLEKNNGFLPLSDKSPPALIYQQLNMSKKAFKKAVGLLYKQRRISIEKDGIHLRKP